MVVYFLIWLYSGKVVVFGQKWLSLGKSGCILGESCVIWAKVVVFERKCFYLGKG